MLLLAMLVAGLLSCNWTAREARGALEDSRLGRYLGAARIAISVAAQLRGRN